MGKYDDIINLPHHNSVKHPRMARLARAAQFAPFAALTGLDDEMDETARLTDRKIELDENEKEQINRRLVYIKENLPINAAITFFVPDTAKSGGAYITQSIEIRKIDELSEQIVTADRQAIPLGNILAIEFTNHIPQLPSPESVDYTLRLPLE